MRDQKGKASNMSVFVFFLYFSLSWNTSAFRYLSPPRVRASVAVVLTNKHNINNGCLPVKAKQFCSFFSGNSSHPSLIQKAISRAAASNSKAENLMHYLDFQLNICMVNTDKVHLPPSVFFCYLYHAACIINAISLF